jgi:hypothetical protein
MNRIRIAKRTLFLLSMGLLASWLLPASGCGGRMRWITSVHGEPRAVFIRREVPVTKLPSPCPAVVASVVAGDFFLNHRDNLLVEAQVRNESRRSLQRVDVSVRVLDAYQNVLHHRDLFSTRFLEPGDLTEVEVHWAMPRGTAVRVELQVVGMAYTDGETCRVGGGPWGSFAGPGPMGGSGTGGSPAPDEELRGAQQLLNLRGYDCGPADGIWGRRTRMCIESFQRDGDLAVTGVLDPPTRRHLYDAAPAPTRQPTSRETTPGSGREKRSEERGDDDYW